MTSGANGSISMVNSEVPIHQYILTESPYADTFDSISVQSLPQTAFTDVETLVIPYKTNQEILHSERRRLAEYVETGGTILAFGDAFRQWLPGGTWHPVEFDYTWWRRGESLELEIIEPAHPLFANVSRDAYLWHYHGRFDPPADATPLLAAPEGVIMYEQSLGTGKLLATTLDPLHHLGEGAITNPIDTTSALECILDWAGSRGSTGR
ncbi:hypothetical protein ACFOZ7_02860 [Natribaculum luteum]|uniref:ThuA-like domain-containing protein n=1 Tax=Natribaculum luteum TaxID=1586232 RepID=A0ABD5NWB2_9EURY|nr:hypothetical protein [Natribaculum luteum]